MTVELMLRDLLNNGWSVSIEKDLDTVFVKGSYTYRHIQWPNLESLIQMLMHYANYLEQKGSQ